MDMSPEEKIAAPPGKQCSKAHARAGVSDLSTTEGVRLYAGDCNMILPGIETASVHMVLSDPPYFLDGLDNRWTKGTIPKRVNGSVGGLPIGMRFDPAQGRALQAFLSPVYSEIFRILKPGGFMLMFSAPRLYHRMAVAAEERGFEIRDQYAWRFQARAQFKAFTLNHFVRRKTGLSRSKKAQMIAALRGRKTPQLRPQFEAILCAQKPREGTFLNNWLTHQTGLIDPAQALTGNTPATVMPVEKDRKRSGHLTPKPMRLCEHLIRLFTTEEQTVLDPFVGSGTTCVAAHHADRQSIGIDISRNYIEITRQRLEQMLEATANPP